MAKRGVSFFSMTNVASVMLLAVEVVGAKEFREHAAHAPAIVELRRPRHLQVRLRAAAGDGDSTGRQRHARDDRKVDLSRYRADLPFDPGADVAKPDIAGAAYAGEVGRQIDQDFEAGRDAEPPSAVGAVDALIPSCALTFTPFSFCRLPTGMTDARIGHVRPVGRDFFRCLRATVRVCTGSGQQH